MAVFSTTTQQLHTVTLAAVQVAPLASRREMLVQMFSETPTKELAGTYPQLLRDMFGFGGRPGWNMQLVTRKCHPREFDQLRMLLEPNGPLFSLIYRLVAEPHLKYEFPAASLLPSQQQQQWSTQTAAFSSPFSPLSPSSPLSRGAGTCAAPLYLNAFELYLHHFCCFLLEPAQQAAPITWTAPGDALFPTLLEDLMVYFLPLNAAWVPPLSGGVGHSPPPPASLSPDRRQLATPPRLLLRSSLLRTPGSPCASAGAASPTSGSAAAAAGHAPVETWRSEALLRILVTFWLESGPRPGAAAPINANVYDALGASRLGFLDFGARIPSHDQVRVVRMLVKHMHYFAHAPHSQPAVVEFKRQAASLLQRRLYAWLRYTLQHWPRDGSLRLVLETWLSYLQPWRYADASSRARSPAAAAAADSDRLLVQPGWARFVSGNLLLYTAVFRQLLPRLLQADLTGPRHAHMVFRIAKVLGQPGLPELVKEAEAAVAPRSGVSLALRVNTLHAAAVAQHIAELEEGGYTYRSMFDASAKQQVHALCVRLSEAAAAVRSEAALHRTPASISFWTGLLSVLAGRAADNTVGQHTADELSKAAAHLDSALQILTHMYELPLPSPPSALASPDSPHTPVSAITTHSQRSAATPGLAGGLTPSALQSPVAGRGGAAPASVPDWEETPEGPRLTAAGRRRLISGVTRAHVQYRGDPDLVPVQRCESAVLVRLTLALSQYVHQQHGAMLADLYSRSDLAGYTARRLLCPPATYQQTERLPAGRSVTRAVHKPAGVRLRPLADLRCVAAVGLLLMALVLLAGLPLAAALLVLLCLPLLWAVTAGAADMLTDSWRGGVSAHQTTQSAEMMSPTQPTEPDSPATPRR